MAAEDEGTAQASEALRAAWEGMMQRLSRARDALESPELHAPPLSGPRELAEGYRYLLGYTLGAVERAFFGDPDFPYFRRSIQPLDKGTIDNADASYLHCRIDGEATYRIDGRVHDSRHWRGEPAAPSGPIGPRYLIAEVHAGYAGDTGDIGELQPGTRGNTGTLDSSALTVDAHGRFEILLAPERPPGHTGDFIPTRRVSRRAGTTFYADSVTLRLLFADWEREQAPDLHVVRVDKAGEHPPALDADQAATRMRRVGEIVEHQVRFWNQFYDVVLGAHGGRDDMVRPMPVNDMNPPAGASLATGGGQSTNTYSGGRFDLEPDEALLIDTLAASPPDYQGFHLSNVWGESLDFANHTSSLNGHQARADADGHLRYVVAHRDPGVPNWLDTTGLRHGYLTARWAYSTPPADPPVVSTRRLLLAEVREHLPEDTPRFGPEERREQIRVRQEHVQRRYRQY